MAVERGGVVDQGRAYLLSALAQTSRVSERTMRANLEKLGVKPCVIGRREWVSGTAFVLAIDEAAGAADPE